VLAGGTVILVHLGRPPDFVGYYAARTASLLPSYRTVLITDQPVGRFPEVRSGHPTFEVVDIASVVSPEQRRALRLNLSEAGFNLRFRRGYWERVFLRFLAIENFARSLPGEEPALHLESDVASFVTAEVVAAALSRTEAPALIPMIDASNACPSIMIGRTAADLAELAGYVIREFGANRGLSDMQVLARGVAEGLAAQLPTSPNASEQLLRVSPLLADGGVGELVDARVVFDAAAVGQYLFGIDPRNNRGVLIAGYRETRGGLDPGLWAGWHLAMSSDGNVWVAFESDGITGVLALIHIHAKMIIPLPPGPSAFWLSVLDVANRKTGPRAEVQAFHYTHYAISESVRMMRRTARRAQRRVIPARPSDG
jgi:hypothetical protein